MNKTLPSPKKMSKEQLFWVILNVFPEKASGKEELRDEVRKWYTRVEKEFGSRKFKLHPII